MKQLGIQQVKFPKYKQNHNKDNNLNQNNQNNRQYKNQQQKPLIQGKKQQKSTAQSQMIRIIIALLIAIFIYNSTQQTTINYNQIIKNQKMFIVKNIRGVIPTLSGDIYKLQSNSLSIQVSIAQYLESWRVVHFQNYHQLDSQIFNNYTFTFNKTNLIIQNINCNQTKLIYDWRNYSYNIDFQFIGQTKQLLVGQTNQQILSANLTNIDLNNVQNKQQSNQTNNSELNNNQINNIVDIEQENTIQNSIQQKTIQQNKISQTIIQNTQQQIAQIKKDNKIMNQTILNDENINHGDSTKNNDAKLINIIAKNTQQMQRQEKCKQSINQMKTIILFTSVWTISGHNLYLLMENTHLQQDYYLILKPYP